MTDPSVLNSCGIKLLFFAEKNSSRQLCYHKTQEGVIGDAVEYFFQLIFACKKMESLLKVYFQNEG